MVHAQCGVCTVSRAESVAVMEVISVMELRVDEQEKKIGSSWIRIKVLVISVLVSCSQM